MYFEVDIESIKNAKVEMEASVKKIADIVENCSKIIMDTKECFDTPTADEFRELYNKHMSERLNYIRTETMAYVNKLDKIVQTYNELSNDILTDIQNI